MTPETQRPRRHAWLLFVVCLLVYNANLRGIGSYDSLATSLLPFGIWGGDGLMLDKYASLSEVVRYSMAESRDGHLRNAYPLVTALLVTPLYAPAAMADGLRGEGEWREAMEKVAASCLAGLSVCFLYLALLRIATQRRALLLSLLYAFGTSTWVISSQALWQHGAAELLLSAALWLLLREQLTPATLVALGTLIGLVAANRPPDALLSAGVAAVVIQRSRSRAWQALLPAAAIGAATGFYNWTTFGTLLGGYSKIAGIDFAAPSLERLAGLLLGNRGLLTFSPFLVALVAVRSFPAPLRRVGWWLVAGCLALLLLYTAFPNWPGGSCFGPRFLTDMLPILFVFLAALQNTVGRIGRASFGTAAAFAVVFQAIGAFFAPSGLSTHFSAARGWRAFSPIAALAGGPATPAWAALVYPGLKERKSLAPDVMHGSIRFLATPPSSARPLEFLHLSLELRNESSRTWSSFGNWGGLYAVRLRARFTPVGGESRRSPGAADYWLSAHLRPGEMLRQDYWIRAPFAEGGWKMEIGPAQVGPLGLEAFSEHGLQPLTFDLRVASE